MKPKNGPIKILFLASLFILIISAFLSNKSIRNLINENKWVNHTLEAITKVESLSHSVEKLELIAIIYITNKNNKSLITGREYYNQIINLHKSLVFLTSDNFRQQKALKQLKKEFEEKLNISTTESLNAIITYNEKDFKDIQLLLKQIKAEETRLLSVRTYQVEESQAFLSQFILMGDAFGFTAIIGCFILMSFEIKRREKVERELKEKDKTIEKIKEFEFLSDSIPQIVWTLDARGKLNYYNKNWSEYTGLNIDLETKFDWGDIIHSEELPFCIATLQESILTGKATEIELRLKRAVDNSYRWHLGRWLPMKDESGNIIRWFGTCTDIHDFKKVQDSERVIAERLKNVIRNAPIVISTVNKEGIYTFAEGRGMEDISLKSNSLVGKVAEEVLKDYPDILSNIKSALNGEEITDTAIFEGLVYETHYAPIVKKGVVEEMLAISVDITKSKKAETASQFKSRFLASMSHEIRTPLNAILGFASVLKRNDLSLQKKEEYLNHIFSSGSLLLKLIGDILDLSKIEEGKLELNFESFNLKESILSSISPYKFKANEKGLSFTLNIDNNIPFSMKGDAHRINQVIINLLGNALKFTKEGSISVEVKSLTSIDGKTNINFAVSDTGIGIPPEKQKLIFEPFTQANISIGKEFGGSGLGLSIAKQLVDAMGGELKVKSPTTRCALGQYGTTFEFTLMLEEDLSKNIMDDTSSNKEETLRFDQEIRVLVVEDNEINQVLAEAILTQIGCKIVIANHGEEAIRILEKMEFDIILMDIQMPVMNGYEATRMIREIYSDKIPIVGLSANVYQEDIRNSLEAGMNAHMGKPYTEKEIFNTIKKWTYNFME